MKGILSLALILLTLNVAHGATVTATSYQAPNVPENVIDGNPSTRWSAEGSIQDRIPATLTYDHGSVETMNLVKIAWHNFDKRTPFFELYVSGDGVDWFWVDYESYSTHTQNGFLWAQYTFPEMPVRYVRIDGFGNSSKYFQWVSINEIETGYNPALISSDDILIWFTGEPGLEVRWNVFDHNYNTRWSAGRGATLTFDLYEPMDISGVQMSWHQGNTRQHFFIIELSNDGENWFMVYDGTSSGASLDLETYEFDMPHTARYLRLTGDGNTSKIKKAAGWTSITELRIDTVEGELSGVGTSR